MKSLSIPSALLALIFAATVSSIPMAVRKRDVNPDLVPQFGFQSGINPTGSGDCDGAVDGSDGKPIKIPCQCPPDRNSFIQELNANVAAGHVLNNPSVSLSFPEDNSTASQLARLNAAADTLQNLDGPGKGCPIVSTTFSAQQKAIEAGTPIPAAPAAPAATSSVSTLAAVSSAPAAISSAPAAAPTATDCPAAVTVTVTNAASVAAPSPTVAAAPSASSGTPSAAQISQLAPNLGFTAGKNPTGTGNCDGAVNGSDGKPIEVPCACPPPQDEFIQHLIGDVQAGHAVNNPSVDVSFPTDGSVASQLARINTALVTLQNLNGPGKGCPAVSTTLQAQQKALQAQL